MISPAESVTAPAVATERLTATFRNSRLLLAGLLLLSIFSGVVCLGTLVLTFIALGQLLPLSVDSLYNVVGSVFMTLSCALMAVWLFGQTRRMAHAHVQLDASGIEFCYGTRRKPRKLFLPWREITTIYTWRLRHGQAYRVETSSENFAEFSNYTFFRPRKLAALIVQRTGCPIERIAG
jgi:hypothetical protein